MLNNSTLISIALCTYNGERFIRQQLDSLLAQTYNFIEIIVVDDCSNDQTVAIIKEYQIKHATIKFFSNTQNLGFNKNFERAISYCTGEYIAICDQDDIWYPEKIEVLYQAIGNNWLVFSNSTYIDHQNKNLGKELLPNFTLQNKTFKSLLLYNYVTGHTTLFHKSFLSNVLPLPASDYYDWWIGFVAMYHHKIVYCDRVLTKYRIHEQSFIQHKNTQAILSEIHAKETLNHLRQIKTYPKLTEDDHLFIRNLLIGFTSQRLKLVRLVFHYYAELFPDLKKRNGLSLLNFAIKYAYKKAF